MVDDYANNKERGNEEFGKPVPCMIRAYRQGLNDAIGKVVLKPAWSEEDERNLEGIIDEIEVNKNNAPDYDLATYDRFLSWFKSIKERMGG